MKVGDLVELSAYGKQRDCRWAEATQGCVGVITEANEYPYNPIIYYKIQWCADQDPQWWRALYHPYTRKELKFAKSKKV